MSNVFTLKCSGSTGMAPVALRVTVVYLRQVCYQRVRTEWSDINTCSIGERQRWDLPPTTPPLVSGRDDAAARPASPSGDPADSQGPLAAGCRSG